MPVASCKAISHSSRAQPSCSHQSPEERQGPAAQRISPHISLRFGHAMRTGRPSRRVTAACTGGRKMRSAVTAPSVLDLRAASSLLLSFSFARTALLFTSAPRSKVLHEESFGTVSVQQLQRSDVILTDNSSNPRQCEFEFFRLRRRRKK